MHESLEGVPAAVREQFSILTENIKTLTKVRREIPSGLVAVQVEREVIEQLAALGELRERVFLGSVSGDRITPLEKAPALVEVLDLSGIISPQSHSLIHEQLSH